MPLRQPNLSNWVLTDGISIGLPIDPEGSRKERGWAHSKKTTFAGASRQSAWTLAFS